MPTTQRTMSDDDCGPECSCIWVRSVVLLDGRYALTVEIGLDDLVVILTPEQAVTHAREVFSAAAHAEYDAAVIRQQTALGIGRSAVAFLLEELRSHRAPVEFTAQDILSLRPCVTADMVPFLEVHIKGRDGAPAGQWSLDAARGHAVSVLEASAAIPLDCAYHSYLCNEIEVDQDRAYAVVQDVGVWRKTVRASER